MKKSNLDKILSILENKFIETKEVELDYINPYTLLVATILSAQATDKGVNKATEKLFNICSNPQDMIKLGVDELKKYIKTINFFNNKAKNIIEMSKKLVNNFNSIVPNNMEDLLTLNGVGRKTANIILSVVYKKNAIAVDTHVFRVCNRLGIIKAKNPTDAENQLMKIIPKKYQNSINHYFVLFGRYICKAIKPKCGECELNKYCLYYNKLNKNK